eukprot:TRINITY_DN807_c0_g1_i1.p1 TRINITY_DN807_c0_g1~~TRINITY_DN807_c0_g1_i1.p1  ORF type:complete len:671 (-),score=93.43 TRINITY_DN807_c0_g1_i1:3914-5926(-)
MVSWSGVWRFVGERKMQLTLVYFAAFMALGMALASLGPSIPDLRIQTNSTLATQSFVGAARAAGYLGGAAIGGPLVDNVPGNRVMAISLAGAAIGTAVVPISSTVWMEGLFIVLQGVAMGFLDSGANLMLIYLHGADVNPYMQSMHFFFAFGAFIAPLLVKLSQDTLGTYQYCWWFVSVFMVPVVAALLLYESPQDKSRQSKPVVDPESAADHNSSEISLSFPAWSRTQWGIVILTASFLFFYVGCEVATSNLLVSFIEDRSLAARDTAYSINASFWGALALFRLIAVPVSLKFAPLTMLYCNFASALVALAFMWFGSQSASSLGSFWFGCFLWGASLASSFPTALNLAESLMPLTGTSGSIFMVGASAGEFVIPALFGWAQGNADPPGSSNALLVGSLVVTCAMIACIIFLRLFFYGEPTAAPPAQDRILPSPAESHPARRPPQTPTVAPASPRPLLPLQVRLAVQGNSAHAIASPLNEPRVVPVPASSNAPKPQQLPPRRPLKQSVRPSNPKQRPPAPAPKPQDADEDDAADKYGIPEIDELYQSPPDRTHEPKVHEVVLDSTDPRHHALPALAVAMRQSSIARHADDLGRIWIHSNPAPLSQSYLQFRTCHAWFSPLASGSTAAPQANALQPPSVDPDTVEEGSVKDKAPLLDPVPTDVDESEDPIL